jgi:hypothetical protein
MKCYYVLWDGLKLWKVVLWIGSTCTVSISRLTGQSFVQHFGRCMIVLSVYVFTVKEIALKFIHQWDYTIQRWTQIWQQYIENGRHNWLMLIVVRERMRNKKKKAGNKLRHIHYNSLEVHSSYYNKWDVTYNSSKVPSQVMEL